MDGRPHFPQQNEHMSEMEFFYTLMADKFHRVTTPWEANFFYAPTFNFGVAFWFGGDLVVARIVTIIEWLKSNALAAPFWAAKRGADTAFWASGDMGACTLNNGGIGGSNRAPIGNEDLKEVVVISEYGHTNFSQRDKSDSMRGSHCMRSLRGIVVPTSNEIQDCETIAENTHKKNETRTVLFTFLGANPEGDDVYGQGARWRAKAALKNATDVVFADNVRDEAYFDALRRSVFCLAPSGHGHGNRLTFAMLTWCIPVIIQDGVRQSFDDVLPYWDFALRVPQAELPALDHILRAVPESRREAMRHSVRKHSKYFCWHAREGEPPPSARAYDGVLESMRRKVYQESFAA